MYFGSFQYIPVHFNVIRSISMYSGPFSIYFNSFEFFNQFQAILTFSKQFCSFKAVSLFIYCIKATYCIQNSLFIFHGWKFHLIYRLNSTKADENWIKCQWKMHCFSLKIGLKRIWMNAQGADTNGLCHHRRWIQCVPCIISCQQMGLRP